MFHLFPRADDRIGVLLRFVSLQGHHVPISLELAVVLPVETLVALHVRLVRRSGQRIWRWFLFGQVSIRCGGSKSGTNQRRTAPAAAATAAAATNEHIQHLTAVRVSSLEEVL